MDAALLAQLLVVLVAILICLLAIVLWGEGWEVAHQWKLRAARRASIERYRLSVEAQRNQTSTVTK